MARMNDIESDATKGTRTMSRRWTKTKLVLCSLAAALVGLGSAGLPIGGSTAVAAAAESGSKEGVVCTSNSANGVANFLLTAKDGYISTPDGNSIYMWSYAYNNGGFQHPGPILCVNEGETVNITLNNALSVPTSLQFPGMASVKANGTPSAPQFSTSGALISLAQEADASKSVTYSFKADKPGTFLYESGSDPELQVQMGMFGTIIVKPVQTPDPADPLKAYAYDTFTTQGGVKTQVLEPGSAYNRDKEYVLMLSEIDPDLHVAVEQKHVSKSDDYKVAYHARYFMINGRSFPDTIAPNDAPWLPTQPYSSLTRVQPYDAKTNALPAMLRYASVGKDTYPFHPHSNHERVIGIDGRYLKDNNADLSSEKFGIIVTPGSTQDATFFWTNVEDYTASNIHVAPPNGQNLTEGDFWSGTPFLGQSAQLNPGINGKTTCGEYYHVAHSHDLTQATNYGATFGGMLTLIRVDPPNNASCD